MINFKATGGVEGLITVVKPAGKPISLNVGEVVKAAVLDLLPSGGATLRIKGSTITARTDIPLQKNSEVMLKVIGTPASPNELRLQFMGQAEQSPAASKGEAAGRLLQAMSNLVPEQLSGGDVRTLLKALPADIETLPKEVRLQLQQFLQTSLKATGQGIQGRLEALLSGPLPESLLKDPAVQRLQAGSVGMERLMTTGLRDLFRDTGASLEAKLRAIAEVMQSMDSEAASESDKAAAEKGALKQSLSPESASGLDRDLKAALLQLRQSISELGGETPATRIHPGQKPAAHEAANLRAAAATVDGMLKDIETFQLLSKTTESFYTFLPVQWQQLREGEVSFKQHEGSGKEPPFYSCRISLDLDSFGRLVVMVLMMNNEYSVSFRPENEQLRQALSAHAPELEEQFRQSGLSLGGVKVLDRDDQSFGQLEALAGGGRGLSVKA